MAFLITFPDILICDEVVGTEKCNTVKRRMEKVDRCEGFEAQLVRDMKYSNENMEVTVFWYKKDFRLTLPSYTFTFPSNSQNSKLNTCLLLALPAFENTNTSAFPSWLLLD